LFIPDPDPDIFFIHPGSRIQGSERHRISDPDPQHWYVCQVGHDSSIGLADAGNGMAVMKLKTNLLPFLSVVWLAPSKLLAAGHDCVPVVFYVDSAGKRMRCTGTVR
jgi:hypothetical protein